MVNAVYDPRWLPCQTPHGTVKRWRSPCRAKSRHTGVLPDEYPAFLSWARGYGTNYAQATR